MGQVCAKHQQFYEETCPWCEKMHPMAAGNVVYLAQPNLASYQYYTPICTIWKPHPAGYCGALCTGIPGGFAWKGSAAHLRPERK